MLDTRIRSSTCRPWSEEWYEAQVELLGEAGCLQLGFYPIPESLLLTVVIPVFNEQATIDQIIRRVKEVPVRKEIIIIQDADLEYDPSEYVRLIQPIIEKKADVVYGSRFFGGQPKRVLYFWHYVGNRLLTTMSNCLSNLNLPDMETCFKVFNRQVIDEITPKLAQDRFGFEPEITARIARRNFRIYEMGISYSGRIYEEGKKIGWQDGIKAIWCIVRYGLAD